jgi:CO/xanthine dehydrogenase FAD-binding subunit
VTFLAPTRWEDALAEKAARPDAVPIAGGTDLMVAVNRGGPRPDVLLDLTRVDGLADWSRQDGRLRIGAAVSYARLVRELAGLAPGLAAAARTVGSPQIRNRGTVGGNLASASPAGDCHPPLLAAGAVVELASVRGVRRLPVGELFTGVKRTVLAPDELIAAVDLPVARGPQEFAKVGTRNAMVIAVCSVAVALDPAAGTVGTGLGSVAPTPRRAVRAEVYVTGEIAELGLWDSRDELPDPVATRFGELVAAAAAPIDDVRGTAAYRRHALGVLGRRVLQRAWHGYRTGAP